MVPGEKDIILSAASPSSLGSTRVSTLHCRRLPAAVRSAETLSFLSTALAFGLLALSLSGCTQSSADSRQAEGSGRTLLSLRPKADPALVARIIEEEKKQAERQAQATIYAETAGPEQVQPGLGRTLPNVVRDPISSALIAPPAESVSADGSILASTSNSSATHASYHQAATQLATYESAYSSVPPPPPGALGAGLVPPPPAVTLSTQAQAVADSAAAFYNNPYFNPFGVPAPPQSSAPGRRPSGLFGEGASRGQPEDSNGGQKRKSDFVPITPKGMESRSPYKQRDDLRILWKGALKGSTNLGELSENNRLIEQLVHTDVGLPSESTKGSFNISSRQVESVFKASSVEKIDKRAFPEVRKLQTELVQAYYRYLSTYNKYALVEQTVAARKQEIDLSDSDAEKQRATADLAQSQNDLDAAKEDLHSSEIELASASSPASARSVISRVATIAPSVESLAQGVSQSGSHGSASHTRKIIGFFDSVFKHPHAEAAENPADLTENLDEKVLNNNSATKKKDADKSTANKSKESKGKFGLFGRKVIHTGSDKDVSESNGVKETHKVAKSDDSDLDSAPAPKPAAESEPRHEHSVSASSSPSNINFLLKNVNINPRKSVLTVVVKNSGSETFELNPDAIYIAEGTRKLGSATLRADFDNTSIEPNQEVKGTITILSRPWNDRLVIYLTDGNKTIQLKR